MVKGLYEDDWACYNAKRNELKEKDAIVFAWAERWKVNYLKGKIAQKNPEMNKKIIKEAIHYAQRIRGHRIHVKLLQIVL